MAGTGLVDAHVHWVAVGDRPEQGWISPRMRRGWVFRIVRRRLGAAAGNLRELAVRYQERLRAHLAASRLVARAVLLPLDGAYDESGRLDLSRTNLYVPNDAVLDAARADPAFLPAASINPARRDARDELDRVADLGAVLVKWLPNAQEFDPADRRWRPFLRRLAERRLPLLVHAGHEYAVPSRSQRLGDPAGWRPALDEGVTVIAAHAGSTGTLLGERYHPTFLDLVDRYPNLWADSSALVNPARGPVLRRMLEHGEAARRMTFGTDYPIPALGWYVAVRRGPAAGRAVLVERNPFDRSVLALTALGWEPSSRVLERLLPLTAAR